MKLTNWIDDLHGRKSPYDDLIIFQGTYKIDNNFIQVFNQILSKIEFISWTQNNEKIIVNYLKTLNKYPAFHTVLLEIGKEFKILDGKNFINTIVKNNLIGVPLSIQITFYPTKLKDKELDIFNLKEEEYVIF